MTRILVTGATGSLGSALVRRLTADGADVTALVLPGDRLNGIEPVRSDVSIRFGDVRDQGSLVKAFAGMDLVYNLAGVAVTLNRLHRQMLAVNAEGARNVAHAAARAGVGRLVHTSSISAIGYPPRGVVADETFDLSRSVCANSYAATKTAGERALLEVARKRGVDAVVVNVSAVIAPYSHRKFGWAALVDMAAKGQLMVWPPGGVSLCGTEDFLQGHLRAAGHGRPCERYIVTSENITYRDLFALVCRVVGAPPPRMPVGALTVRLAGRAAGLAGMLQRDVSRMPFFVPENAELAVHDLFYDSGKAQRELGFAPTGIGPSVAAVHEWLQREGEHATAA